MALINSTDGTMHHKLVFYGPGSSGKSTNLVHIQQHAPPVAQCEHVGIQLQTGATKFFDCVRLTIGKVNNLQTYLHLYTVPGHEHFEHTRMAILHGVDGVVFVADSQHQQLDANLRSLQELTDAMEQAGKSLDEVPFVLQYNKRDLPDALPISEIHQHLNQHNWPSFEASATTGKGVFEMLKGISKLVVNQL
jgi:signal recognition particle receptor subunit beta